MLFFSRDRPKTLPKGIHRRDGTYVVDYTKSSGSKGYKTFKTLDEALAFNSVKNDIRDNQVDGDDGLEADAPDGAGDCGDRADEGAA